MIPAKRVLTRGWYLNREGTYLYGVSRRRIKSITFLGPNGILDTRSPLGYLQGDPDYKPFRRLTSTKARALLKVFLIQKAGEFRCLKLK